MILIVTMFAMSCNKESNPSPTNATGPTMTSVETALLGTWIRDKEEVYNPNGVLEEIDYADGRIETYVQGVLYHTTINPASYYHITFLSTLNGTTGYYNDNIDANGQVSESVWKVEYNYANSGHDKVTALIAPYIYTLNASELITRNNTNPYLQSTAIYYYHKQ